MNRRKEQKTVMNEVNAMLAGKYILSYLCAGLERIGDRCVCIQIQFIQTGDGLSRQKRGRERKVPRYLDEHVHARDNNLTHEDDSHDKKITGLEGREAFLEVIYDDGKRY